MVAAKTHLPFGAWGKPFSSLESRSAGVILIGMDTVRCGHDIRRCHSGSIWSTGTLDARVHSSRMVGKQEVTRLFPSCPSSRTGRFAVDSVASLPNPVSTRTTALSYLYRAPVFGLARPSDLCQCLKNDQFEYKSLPSSNVRGETPEIKVSPQQALQPVRRPYFEAPRGVVFPVPAVPLAAVHSFRGSSHCDLRCGPVLPPR
jgi:hypothetical protein